MGGGIHRCFPPLAGRLESAQRSAVEVMRLWPEFSSRTFVAKEPFKFAHDREHLLEGFGKAGLPE